MCVHYIGQKISVGSPVPKTKGGQNQEVNLCLKCRELKTFRVHCLGYIINQGREAPHFLTGLSSVFEKKVGDFLRQRSESPMK